MVGDPFVFGGGFNLSPKRPMTGFQPLLKKLIKKDGYFMKKVLGVLLTLCVLCVCLPALGANLRVEWGSQALAPGDISVGVYGPEDGLTAVLALYGENGLQSVSRARVTNNKAFLTVTAENTDAHSQARVLLWNMETLSPAAATLSTLTEDGIIDGSAYSGPALGTIEGTVRDADAVAIENVEITLSSENLETKTVRTLADGTYIFTDVPVGDYTVTAATPESMEPVGETAVSVTVVEGEAAAADFTFKLKEPEIEKWYSDDQLTNDPSSIGYHSIEALTGEYEIDFELTIAQKGDNAVMLHDSSNTPLDYTKSSVILLFNGDYFAVRNGNGSGAYTADAVNLCSVQVSETYQIKISGNVAENSYTVSVTGKDGKTYTSGLISARTNGSKLDSLALISNSHKTVVNGDNYSDYNFYVTGFESGTIIDEVVYSGFAGRYYGIKANGRYVRGNSGRLSADWTSVKDESAMFLPRDMGDGSFAFLCRSSDRRITAVTNGQLVSGDYDYNGDSQHWVLEKSENYSSDAPAYYLRSLENDRYIGLSGGYLTAVGEADKIELVFEPLNDKSPLRLISETNAYARLSKAQRRRIEMIYETVAGDVFDRYSDTIIGAEWTPRLRIDNIFKEAAGDDELFTRLESFLSDSDGHIMTDSTVSGCTVSSYLPGTDGVTYQVTDGVEGTYDFWRGTMLAGTKYKLTIFAADGSVQQTVDLYVQDEDTSKSNGKTFPEAFARIPYAYRKNIQSVKIRDDSANSYNCGFSDLYIRLSWTPNTDQMLCTICHEMSHSVSSGAGGWAEGSGWAQAIENDMIFVSPYGNSNATEDFAEFGRLYFICYGNRDRQRAIQLLFPNRYASYYRLRHSSLGGFELWEDTEYPEYQV